MSTNWTPKQRDNSAELVADLLNFGGMVFSYPKKNLTIVMQPIVSGFSRMSNAICGTDELRFDPLIGAAVAASREGILLPCENAEGMQDWAERVANGFDDVMFW
jgi:hypothetical protein